jgi:hypothetical protein
MAMPLETPKDWSKRPLYVRRSESKASQWQVKYGFEAFFKCQMTGNKPVANLLYRSAMSATELRAHLL